jgi:hypothetical protein
MVPPEPGAETRPISETQRRRMMAQLRELGHDLRSAAGRRLALVTLGGWLEPPGVVESTTKLTEAQAHLLLYRLDQAVKARTQASQGQAADESPPPPDEEPPDHANEDPDPGDPAHDS